ncbi:MAG TPA: hypothetical protein H9870_01015 [Candidatus Corynebacterium avicola]|uniref:J domain-containing protein n=1 Tax=Candidatus Corynebacterium avicola TaxID=2838527 RepID=A0A9D1UL01_9CORY|nr:hypothetical protein [Candidatus Corynebacterium avicola]
MAHYNIYQSLGLDRSASSQDLAQQLDGRLASTSATDAGAREELSVARAILGDETRRGLYDQRLDDPSAAEIDIDSLRELASLNLGGQSGPYAGAKTATASNKSRSSFRQSKGPVILVTAVVTALVCGIAGWALGLFSSDPDKDAKSVVNEMLEQDDADDLTSWLEDNAGDEDRDYIMESLELDDSESFDGMEDLFGGKDLSAGERVMDAEQVKMVMGSSTEEYHEQAEEEGYTSEEVDSALFISVVDGDDEPRGMVGTMERDGERVVIAVNPMEQD